VIRWSPDPANYIANALSPARVEEVRLMDPDERQAHVLVPEDQLSLAIGKEGQNVRLAARLTGWKIDIKDFAKYDREAEDALVSVVLDRRATEQAERDAIAAEEAALEAQYAIEDAEWEAARAAKLAAAAAAAPVVAAAVDEVDEVAIETDELNEAASETEEE
jgi:transcription termination/antitermination protein NusA